MRCAHRRAQSLGHALLVVGKVSFECNAPHALLRNPKVTQHLSDGQRVLFRAPRHLFRTHHSCHLSRACADYFFLFQEEFLEIHGGEYNPARPAKEPTSFTATLEKSFLAVLDSPPNAA